MVLLVEEVATTAMLVTPDGVVGTADGLVGTGGADELSRPPPQEAKIANTAPIRISKSAWCLCEATPPNAIPIKLKLANATSNPPLLECGLVTGRNSDAIPAVCRTSVELTTDVPAVRVGGVKVQFEAAGRLAHESLTCELNPLKPATEMVIVVD